MPENPRQEVPTPEMSVQRVAAIDLGASSGRVVGVSLNDGTVAIDAVHRFENEAEERTVGDGSRWCWNMEKLQAGIEEGLSVVAGSGVIESIGVDSWGVDYGLLDEREELVAPVTAYRDSRHQNGFNRLRKKLGEERIYARTGIQFQPFNTLYQLAADAIDPDRPLDQARRMLMMPDLIANRLCGSVVGERTNASTTQCFDLAESRWITEFLDAAGVSEELMPEGVSGESAAPLCTLDPAIARSCALSMDTPVRATASHDTAAAIVAAPLENVGDVFISSGTWSLVGMELDQPLRTEAARKANFTNEAGVFGTVRFLRNVAGLWLLQECRRQWRSEGVDHDWPTLQAMAEKSTPFQTVFDPDLPSLAAPGDMPRRIMDHCRRLGEPVPQDHGAMVRSILDSLALRYERVVRDLERLTGHPPRDLVVVGGGGSNHLLNQLASATTGMEVRLGPTEATALGNALVQYASAEGIDSLGALRKHLPTARVEASPDDLPEVVDRLDDVRARFDTQCHEPLIHE